MNHSSSMPLLMQGMGNKMQKHAKTNDCKELCALWWATLEQDDSDSD